jgi:ABC-2 type transport system permease protein
VNELKNSTAHRELLVRSTAALRRSATWWCVGLVAFIAVNLAFWPSLSGSDALASLEESTGSLLEAFGAQGISTPEGYLDGQVFAFLLPLLLSGMAVAMLSAITAGDEDGGRLELIHALPVGRQAVWLARFAASAAAVATVTVVLGVTLLPQLLLFSFEGVSWWRVLSATAACGLLALFHAAVTYLAAAAGLSRARTVGVATVVLVVGYLASVVLPLAEALEPFRRVSPWYWALGVQPVSDGVSPAGVTVLLVVTAALVLGGTALIGRRDIRGA